MNFAIIGCGGIGRKRAKALFDLGHSVRYVVDVDEGKAHDFADEINTVGITPEVWRSVLARDLSMSMSEPSGPIVSAAIIATAHNALAGYALEAAASGKHVFIEKPGAITRLELQHVFDKAKEKGVFVQVGYNHRVHPGILQARDLVCELGGVLYIRGRYGHGGRLGYEKEWRMDRALSGGGELMDQGVHLINLSLMFLSAIGKVSGNLARYHWQADVEDNAFILLEDVLGHVAQLHASWTEWKNLFSFEIFCQYGKVEVLGLGGSYGKEQIIVHRMDKATMSPPDTEIRAFNREDFSWAHELDTFIVHTQNPDCWENVRYEDADDALTTLRIVEAIQAKCRKSFTSSDGV